MPLCNYSIIYYSSSWQHTVLCACPVFRSMLQKAFLRDPLWALLCLPFIEIVFYISEILISTTTATMQWGWTKTQTLKGEETGCTGNVFIRAGEKQMPAWGSLGNSLETRAGAVWLRARLLEHGLRLGLGLTRWGTGDRDKNHSRWNNRKQETGLVRGKQETSKQGKCRWSGLKLSMPACSTDCDLVMSGWGTVELMGWWKRLSRLAR